MGKVHQVSICFLNQWKSSSGCFMSVSSSSILGVGSLFFFFLLVLKVLWNGLPINDQLTELEDIEHICSMFSIMQTENHIYIWFFFRLKCWS